VVLTVLGEWFEFSLESGLNCPWKAVLIVLGKWFYLFLESGFNCFW
jgi:hypothetical protein